MNRCHHARVKINWGLHCSSCTKSTPSICSTLRIAIVGTRSHAQYKAKGQTGQHYKIC